MTKQLLLWRFIQYYLEQDIAVMLMYVLDSKGSSPGRRGFAMAVTADGKTQGSIGGGIMEHKFVEMSIAQLNNRDSEIMPVVRKQIHDKAVAQNQSGMICSGEQTIFIYPVKKQDINVVNALVSTLQTNNPMWLQLTLDGIFLLEKNTMHEEGWLTKQDDSWVYIERMAHANRLHIIGGGHCALALSKLMHSMDFYIVLYEERQELETLQANQYVHEVKILEDYNELSATVEGGENTYVVIMTVGYRTDYIAIKALLHKHFKYMGILGSKKKMEKLLAQLQAEGIAGNVLEKLHTPIGISINSQTPEEIAISIAAEIISIKNAGAN